MRLRRRRLPRHRAFIIGRLALHAEVRLREFLDPREVVSAELRAIRRVELAVHLPAVLRDVEGTGGVREIVVVERDVGNGESERSADKGRGRDSLPREGRRERDTEARSAARGRRGILREEQGARVMLSR